jgi:hypothetical protein
MEALVVRFLSSAAAAAVSPTSPFDNCLQLRSHQGVVMIEVLNNFLNLHKLFLAVASDFTKLL